jgi:hypothetical protein
MADDDKIKVTLRLAAALVKRAKHFAVDADLDLQDVVTQALEQFLGKKGGR